MVLLMQLEKRAAPQDVDVSLMVLAAKKHNSGMDVVLVSDDYKMTTTRKGWLGLQDLSSIDLHSELIQ